MTSSSSSSSSVTIIFFTIEFTSASDSVPFRTGGRGATTFAPAASTSDELADDDGKSSGDFRGDVLTEEAADFTGDVTGDAATGEATFGVSLAAGESAKGELSAAGATMVSGEATGSGEGVLFDWSATTGLDTSGRALGWEASAFEATF